MFNPFDFGEHPGRAYVVATLLPLVPVLLLLISSTIRNLARMRSGVDSFAARLYWLFGGDQPLKTGGYLSLVCLLGSFGLSVWGLVQYHAETQSISGMMGPDTHRDRWNERGDWLEIGPRTHSDAAGSLQVGYHIDYLSALLFTMVTGIGSLIFLFSLGYMQPETAETVEDHVLHLKRRGRFGRFYLYLSLFAFSMLNLLIADNLFQVFVGWELVGVCSFFLIGFYYERPTASAAANKAYIINRIGDAGFLIAICIAFAEFGTLNIRELSGSFIDPELPRMPHDLWIAMGLGLFFGCVGKSAQVPLQTWLPDAMEGPTPVSALIHAATMVAAGVYLVARCYPLFAPEVLTLIAYIGLITLVLSALTAMVMTDIKRILAFSTCSQLGFMMLALGVGAWTAAILHLITHAFFKALLFLGAGSVIRGCHHEQDVRKMGGLRKSMPITAYTMLVGVLAISGTPFFSGWYSKDQILSGALGHAVAHREHVLLFVAPWLTAGLTTFYMFRLWLLAFTGTQRDPALNAHESPITMTLPLIVLALGSLGIAWGWPFWDAEASFLGQLLNTKDYFSLQSNKTPSSLLESRQQAEYLHTYASGLAMFIALCGAVWGWHRYGRRAPTRSQLAEPRGAAAERWYFDEIYNCFVFEPVRGLGFFAAAADRVGPDERPRLTLDGFWNGLAHSAVFLGESLRMLQTGRVRDYVLAMALTLLGLLGMLTAFAR